jgi:hypothetical protein
MQEEIKIEPKQEATSSSPINETINNRPRWLIISVVALTVIVIISGAVVAGIQIGKKRGVSSLLPSPTPPNSIAENTPAPVRVSPEPSNPDIEPTQKKSTTYTVPQGWQKYSDSEAGITINYPPLYTAKYNSNRGFGTGNFAAGSYLLDSAGQKILDFYYFAYEGGSRRDAFYKTIDWDYTVQEISKHTISVSDVVLNNKTFLKIVTNFGAWRGSDYVEKRVFFLLPQGDKMYYFTYPYSVESRSNDYKNILTVIATITITGGTSGGQNLPTTYCYPRPDSNNRGTYWDSTIDEEGNMVITQRTDKTLKQQTIDKSKIEVSGNPQKIPSTYFSITNFDVNIDSSKKGSYQDAFVIKVKKADVDKIKADTPSSIPSIAVIVSISGGVETSGGEICKSHLYGYYVSRP